LAIAGYFISYDALLSFIVAQSGKPYLLPLLRDQFFTAQKFVFSRYILSLLALLYSGLVVYLWRVLPQYESYIQITRRNIAHYCAWLGYGYRLIPSYLKIILGIALGLFIAKAIYYLQFPMQYDEAWSYNYFIDNSPLISLAAYNNHPLLTLMGHLFKHLPFDMQFNLRLPVFLAGVLCVGLLWVQLRYWFGTEAAVVGTLFFAFCCPITFYMLYARAYIFTVLFTQLLLVVHFSGMGNATTPHACANNAVHSPVSVLLHFVSSHLFSIFWVALGLYSMPTFIYCLVPFGIYYIIRLLQQFLPTMSFAQLNKDDKAKVGTIWLGILLALFFYMPMLLGTGIDLGWGVANQGLTLSEIRQQLGHYVLLVWYFLTGTVIQYSYIVILALLLIWAIRGIKQTLQRHLVILSAGSLCLPIAALCLQGTAVPERVWTFLSVYMAIIITAISYRALAYLPKRAHRYGLITLLAAIFIVGQSYLVYRHDFVNWSYERDKSAQQIAQLMLQAKIDTYYTNFDYYKPALEYYYRLSNKPIRAFSADPNSANYAHWLPNTSTYPCIISHKEAAQGLHLSTNYHAVFENEETLVYFRQKNNGSDDNCP
jgi:hypothetical protein